VPSSYYCITRSILWSFRIKGDDGVSEETKGYGRRQIKTGLDPLGYKNASLQRGGRYVLGGKVGYLYASLTHADE
jgi:hypothetical protein